MKSLYITSVERYSGKTATCLALGLRFKGDGYKVGYLKPLSLQPFRLGDKVVDEDAAFVHDILELEADPAELAPVILSPEYLREHLSMPDEEDRMQRVKSAFQAAGQGQDILLLEGGASLREGYVVDLPTVKVAHELGSHVLVIAKYRDDIRLMDDILASKGRLGDAMAGVLINRVPEEAQTFLKDYAVPFLDHKGIPVIGILPEDRSLSAFTVGELIPLIEAEVLTRFLRPSALVENMTVGAMTADAALSRFRRYSNKAVITGGDRTDIQLPDPDRKPAPQSVGHQAGGRIRGSRFTRAAQYDGNHQQDRAGIREDTPGRDQ
jgi:BioD-like phosphotransacetylase family protein